MRAMDWGSGTEYPPNRKVLVGIGSWQLCVVGDSFVKDQGWQSVIRHDCESVGGAYWMLIEKHTQATQCTYCLEPMPDGIVALFKFQNERLIQ